MTQENTKPERLPPLPEAVRAEQTQALMEAGATDHARWAAEVNLATQWDARAERAAAHIPAGVCVLDIGAGAMALRRCLAPGCRYVPADVVARAPDCLVTDLNAGQFPEGRYDWVTFLGVLEYIHDMKRALERAAEAAPRLLFTYCVDITEGRAVALRRGMGWVNDCTLEQVQRLLEQTGWRIAGQSLDKQGPHNHQMMFVCERG